MSRDEHIRRRAASLGYDRSIAGTGVLPSDVVDLFAAGAIDRADLLERLRRMPDAVLDRGATDSAADIAERYRELRSVPGVIWIIYEALQRVERVENTGSAIVTTYIEI
ncbi:hypothetical protein [Aureimonas sp. SK2]|uniref:hypothetical protein n=1 Tax=Aureimonas sp. SK2 TaxID=3015992 RepID=UPI002444C287|nr:hypothetical protein [Aureimonas sp. SK2]